jgi:hypothetical protein
MACALVPCSGLAWSAPWDRHEKVQVDPPERGIQAVGDALDVSFDVVIGGHFHVYHLANPADAEEICRVLEAARKQFAVTFRVLDVDLDRLGRPLVWLCFDGRATLDRYASLADGVDRLWLDSYYSMRTNRVALVRPFPGWASRPQTAASERVAAGPRSETAFPAHQDPGAAKRAGFARLTHEVAHQLAFNSGLQRRGVMYPFWISEGLATNFEFDTPADLSVGACSETRARCVVEARERGELAPLRDFVVRTSPPRDAAPSRRCYAQAWSLFAYVMRERDDELARYLQHVATRTPGRRNADVLLGEFVMAFGDPEEVERSWLADLDRRSRRVSHAGSRASGADSRRAPRLD